MAKKKNPFQNLDLQQVKIELTRNVDYLASIQVEELQDDITDNVTAQGGVIPIVETSIEQKLDSYIVLIKDSVDQLKYITDIEQEVSVFVDTLLQKLKKHMKEIQDYFEKRPPESLCVRNWVMEKTNKKTGYTYQIKKLVANVPTQIKTRSRILKIILELQPKVATIEEAKGEELSIRGGKEVPWLMRARL
jgi:hypothetical protein